MIKKYLTYIGIVGFCYAHTQDISRSILGSSGNSQSSPSLIANHTTGELAITTINNSTLTLTQGFHQPSKTLTIAPKVYLQGALVNSPNNLMRDDLRTNNLIPLTSPYNSKVSTSATVLGTTGDNAIVDWIEIELRNSNNNTVAHKFGLLQRDGDVVSADGSSPIKFNTHNNAYFVIVNHRNHLGAMSSTPISLSTTLTSTPIDFTDGSIITYGSFAQTSNNTPNGVFALWAGDANSNNAIRYLGTANDTNTLKTLVLTHPDNITSSNLFLFSEYSNGDLNMDGIVRYLGANNDSNILKSNVLNHPLNTNSSNLFLFNEQL